LYVASITEPHASIQKLKFLNRKKLSLHTNRRPQWATVQLCDWPVEFGKIYRKKLQALMTTCRGHNQTAKGQGWMQPVNCLNCCVLWLNWLSFTVFILVLFCRKTECKRLF